jgi:hypothetical protein
MTDVAATIGLLAIFVGLFPVLVHVIVGYIAAQVAAEHRENEAYRHRRG